MKLELIREGMK